MGLFRHLWRRCASGGAHAGKGQPACLAMLATLTVQLVIPAKDVAEAVGEFVEMADGCQRDLRFHPEPNVSPAFTTKRHDELPVSGMSCPSRKILASA